MSHAAEDKAELARVELSGDGPARDQGHMTMPDFVREHTGFSLFSAEQRIAWFRSMCLAGIEEGCCYFRYTVDRPVDPNRGLVEGWTSQQDPYRMVPVQWPHVDRMPTEGVVSATEDLTAVVKPPDQEIRA